MRRRFTSERTGHHWTETGIPLPVVSRTGRFVNIASGDVKGTKKGLLMKTLVLGRKFQAGFLCLCKKFKWLKFVILSKRFMFDVCDHDIEATHVQAIYSYEESEQYTIQQATNSSKSIHVLLVRLNIQTRLKPV